MKSFIVLYLKSNELTGEKLFSGDIPSVNDLKLSYCPIALVHAEDEDDVFCKMQAEYWSPNGEAKEIIRESDTWHTSMMTCDLIYDLEDNSFVKTMMFGFSEKFWFNKEVEVYLEMIKNALTVVNERIESKYDYV